MEKYPIVKRVLIRFLRCVTGQKGVWCKKGKKNHIASGTILYEPCVVGNYNYFAPYTLAYNAKIGNYCSIGPGCKIGLAEHDLYAVSTRASINNGNGEMELFDYSNPTIIGNDVWLGANVVVRQGVTIGDGAVIGANAVVIDNIPPYAIAVGIPANVKSFRFDKNTIDLLINSEWYNCDIEDAKNKCKELCDDIENRVRSND